MKKALRFGSPIVTTALFVLAVSLLLGSSIGGARAALTYYSEAYSAQVQMYDIGVTLNENGAAVSKRDYKPNSNGEWDEVTGTLLKDRWSEENPFYIGTAYTEEISVTNSGTIDEYVRVNLYRYWLKDEKKQQDLDPSLIEWGLANLGDDWILDTRASTDERLVLYYNRVLPSGQTTVPVTDLLTINSMVESMADRYNDTDFWIEAEVDAVQSHNAVDAIWSAWGRRVHINNDGILSLD